MKLIIEENYEDMSQVAANILLGKMLENKQRCNISITAGRTPRKVYEILVPQVKNKQYFDHVYYHNFDEIPLPKQKLGVTLTNLYNMYFQPANIKEEQIIPLNELNYPTHIDKIRKSGGLDLMLLGLGEDGHFCGNLPHAVKFEDEMVKVSKNATPDMEEILLEEVGNDESKLPQYYVTMGPNFVMETKRLVMIANGKEKAGAIKKLIEGSVTLDFPASILKLHPNFTLIIDEEAASFLA